MNNGDSSNAIADASRDVENHLYRGCHSFKLPNELLSKLVGLLYDEELLYFAMARRSFYVLATRALGEHRRVVSERTTVSNINKPPGYLASKILRTLLFYSSGLEGARIDREFTITEARGDDCGKFIDKLLANATGALNTSPRLLRSLERGEEWALVPFLCAMLPNITNLDYQSTSRDDNSAVLNLVLRSSQSATIDERGFANLKRINILGSLNDYNHTFELVKTCAQMLSMEIIVSYNCGMQREINPHNGQGSR